MSHEADAEALTPVEPTSIPAGASVQRDMGVAGDMAASIRQFPWHATGLGPMLDWPAHLRSAVDLMLGHGFPMIVLWGPDLIQLYNDGYARVLGDKHPIGLGLPTEVCWPEVWHINGPIYARVWRGETITYEDKLYPLARRNGELEDAWFTLTYSPIRDAAGQVDGVLVTMFETTAQHHAQDLRERAERERRESDERLALAFKVLPVGLCIVETDGHVVMSNDVMRTYLPTDQVPSADPINVVRWQAWQSDGTPLGRESFPAARALRGDTVVPGVEFLYTHNDGRRTWTRVAAAPLRDAEGAITGVFSVVVDIDDIKCNAEKLRVNEERFRQFSEASSDILWIRDARTFEAELLSNAFDATHGLPRAAVMGALRHWAALVVPEDRNDVVAHLNQVRQGQSRVQEYRIQRRSDGVFRWIRDTAFPLYDSSGRVSRVAGISTDITDARRSAGHQAVLVAELQHRVRNLMAMISSIVWRTQDTAVSVQDYAQLLSGRMMSLARTQALLTRAANVGVCLRHLIDEELAAVAADASAYTLSGPAVTIPPKAAEVLSLAIHELATNALKYGALADDGGNITVTWTHERRPGDAWLQLHWQEQRPPSPGWHAPGRRGFGSALVEERVPYELAGMGTIVHEADGTCANIGFPLRGRDSILQTDAPDQARIDGGALDMAGELDWQGRTALVVDDDYYLAEDMAAALRSTGAGILGPFSSLGDAVAALERQRPDMAVVDINLGQGPTTLLVNALQAAHVPFVVVTGYETASLPAAVRTAHCIQKPAAPREVLHTLARVAEGTALPATATAAR